MDAPRIPMTSKSDEQIQLIVGTIREEMELTTRSYSTRNHNEDRQSLVEFGPVNQWYELKAVSLKCTL